MNTEPLTLGAGSFTAKVRCGEERQTEIHGSCLVVQSSVVFSHLCKVHIQARGDRFSKVFVLSRLCVEGHQGKMEKMGRGEEAPFSSPPPSRSPG